MGGKLSSLEAATSTSEKKGGTSGVPTKAWQDRTWATYSFLKVINARA